MSHPQPAPWGGAPAAPAPGGYPALGAHPGSAHPGQQPTGYPAPAGYPAPTGYPAPGGHPAPGGPPATAGQPVPAGQPAPGGQPGYAAPGQYAGPAAHGAPVGHELPAPYSAQPDPAVAGYPAAQPGHPPQGMLACRFCGSVPAARATFRGHQGMVVIMRFLSNEGPFCRDCGLGVFRHMTSRTLVQGWYGYGSFIITPFTVLMNLIRRGRVAKLATPQPNPYAPSRPPMDPGPRLLERPMTWIGIMIPIVLFGLIAFAATQN
ncbi:hypothetical protein [Actinoplanes teichomyceticus]|uniref:Uncharacterized protein n=1 Tax=Actinoplanes teichomyceticus TaxID=1867 RepID=A0A561VLZ1_ACTTI|nr:hypothetical protein [Actinoplanes teichomyceticus]TWG12630.1 hypothetical protein FHX34_105497 [Actinoplanes teichomyceticus]GIF14000.1 hypothetical protein Ate01nite_40320 [Actinoplanes teichomyceticus]